MVKVKVKVKVNVNNLNVRTLPRFAFSSVGRRVPRFSESPLLGPTRYESVGCDANAKRALVCDEENFSFPEECCLQPLVLQRSLACEFQGGEAPLCLQVPSLRGPTRKERWLRQLKLSFTKESASAARGERPPFDVANLLHLFLANGIDYKFV